MGRTINVGSMGGFNAIKRHEADIAGVHLQDEKTGEYNTPFLTTFGLEDSAVLVRGYDREQGLIVKHGNPKKVKGVEDLLRADISFINRNKGSGTRLLIDRHLSRIASSRGTDLEDLTKRIRGYGYEAKSHSAIASAVKNDRADVGFGIKTAAAISGLDFIKIDDEKYDFLISKERLNKKSIKTFIELLQSKEFASALHERAPGLAPNNQSGRIILQT